MISRRTLIATGALAAVAASIPPLAIAHPTPTEVMSLSWRQNIDRVIATLHGYGFDHQRTVHAFRLEVHAPRTAMELGDMVELFAVTYRDPDMRSRVSSLSNIIDGLEKKFPGDTYAQRKWLANTQPIFNYDCVDLLRTGSPADLQLVSIMVEHA